MIKQKGSRSAAPSDAAVSGFFLPLLNKKRDSFQKNWKESHVKQFPANCLQFLTYILNDRISPGFHLLFMYILCIRPFGVHIPVLYKKDIKL